MAVDGSEIDDQAVAAAAAAVVRKSGKKKKQFTTKASIYLYSFDSMLSIIDQVSQVEESRLGKKMQRQ
ncbi:hypothetical protein GGI21_006007, partial [Coemansia aciculifera]